MLSRIVSKSSSPAAFERTFVVARQENRVLAGRLPQAGPIGRSLHQKQHGIGFVRRGQAIGHFAECLKLVGEFARNGHDKTRECRSE